MYRREYGDKEGKNAELKHRHGLDVARSSGLFNMELQAATTIFVVKYEKYYGSNRPKIGDREEKRNLSGRR